MNIKLSHILFLTLAAIIVFSFLTRNTILRSSINRIRSRFLNGPSITSEYKRDEVILKYRYFEPVTSDPAPLVVLLHGAGERGSDNIRQLDYTTISFIKEIRKKYSPLIILPQCPENLAWTINPARPFNNFKLDSIPVSITLEIVKDIVLELTGKYHVDKNRIYIIGYSMGGTGTWEMIFRNPGLFAAAVPICAASDPSKAISVRDIHIWAFSAENDRSYDHRETEKMVEKIKEINGSIKYTLYKNEGHFIWDRIFKDPAVSEWLFSQRKKVS